MYCEHCGHPIPDASQRFCAQCGEPLEDTGEVSYDAEAGELAPGEGEWEEPPPPGPSRYVAAGVEWVREATGQLGLGLQDVLEDLRQRAWLPGGSLTLLGVGLVGGALLLSALPFVSGLGVFWSAVMLLGGALVAVNEWRELRTEGVRALPSVLENLPEVTRHPRIAQAYALLTCAHALMTLGFGLVPALWLFAAVVLGYEQGQRFLAGLPRRRDGFEPEQESLRFRLHPWVVAGAVLCTLALYLPWARSNLPLFGVSGREQPLATFTLLALLVLGGLATQRRGLASVPILLPVLMAVWLTVWFFLMLNPYTVGPWLFLPGLLTLDAVTALHLLQASPDDEA